MVKNLKILTVLTILCIPFYWIKFKLFGIPLNVLEIPAILTIILFYFFKRREICSIFLRKELIVFLIILIGLFLSMFFAQDKLSALGIIKSWFIIPFLFGLAAKEIFQEQKERVLSALLASGALIVAIGLIYWFLGNLTYDGRLKAFYESPNYLAMYLALVFILNWQFLPKNKTKTVILIGIQTVILLVLFKTHSEGVWLALMGSLAVSFIFIKFENFKKIIIALLILILLVGIVLPILFGLNKDLVLEKFNIAYRSSEHSRLMIWQSAVEIIKENWLLGVGAGNFQNVYLDFQKRFKELYLEWSAPQPHNIFLAFWLESGLLGLIGFLLLFFLIIRSALNIQDNKKAKFLFLAFFLYIIFHGFIDTTYWKNDLSFVFWLIAFMI